MLKVEKYSVTEVLRDGCRVEIRTLRPDDRADLLAAINRTSDQSRYRRFFGLKRSFTDQEAAFIVNVDFVNHVALVALIDEEGRSVIAGGPIAAGVSIIPCSISYCWQPGRRSILRAGFSSYRPLFFIDHVTLRLYHEERVRREG